MLGGYPIPNDVIMITLNINEKYLEFQDHCFAMNIDQTVHIKLLCTDRDKDDAHRAAMQAVITKVKFVRGRGICKCCNLMAIVIIHTNINKNDNNDGTINTNLMIVVLLIQILKKDLLIFIVLLIAID